MPFPWSKGGGMRRRDFICILAVAAAWPIIARAQQASKVYRLGYLAPARLQHLQDALIGALRDLGYVGGQNLKIEYRYGVGEGLDALAAELVELKPDLIVTVGSAQALAAKRATTTIPVVMATAGDPLRLGVVTSLARPGGNVTGVTLYATELSAKRIELFREAVPSIKRLACLANAKNPYGQVLWQETEPAARALGLEPMLFQLQKLGDLPATFREMEVRTLTRSSSFRTLCSTVHGGRSLRSQPNIVCLRCMKVGSLLRMAASSPMGRTSSK